MRTLGIETTCDETAVAIVDNGQTILSNQIASQKLHSRFGGVVPELACRCHIELIEPTLQAALTEANTSLKNIDLIGVPYGPGLIGALMIGLNAAKTLSWTLNIPYVAVNHIEAHLYAAIMSNPPPRFPALGVVLSGGHTTLVKITNWGEYQLISQTVDDAIGEAFDKVARLLGEPYPGGPCIERLAQQGNPLAYPFKSGTVKRDALAFSFSGLKTAILYAVCGQNGHSTQAPELSLQKKADIAASFQRAAFNDIVTKSCLAAKKFACQSLIFGGGVTNNQALRLAFKKAPSSLTQVWPLPEMTTDNGAMIAGLAFAKYAHNKTGSALDLAPQTRLPFWK